MSMIEEGKALPTITESMLDKLVAQCRRCGADLTHRTILYGIAKEGLGLQQTQTLVTVCQTCFPIFHREQEQARNRAFAAELDAQAEKVRGHLADLEQLVRSTISPMEVGLAGGAELDWAALCHGLVMCFHLARRFSAMAHVEADIAAGGTGSGNAPRPEKEVSKT